MATFSARIVAVFCVLVVAVAPLRPARAMQRPVDPWVFAGSLDDHPRILFVALHRDLWVAYDTQRGDVDKAWLGASTEILHAVTSFTDRPPGIDGILYLDNPDENPWRITRNGIVSIPRVNYRGYRLFGEQLTLVYSILTDYGNEIVVEESPEVVYNEEGRPGLQRVFYVEGLPAGSQLSLELIFRMLKDRKDIVADGMMQHSGARSNSHVWGKTYDLEGRLVLQEGRTTTLTSYFAPAILKNLNDVSQFEPVDLFRNTRALQAVTESEAGGTGDRLIRRADHEPGAAVKVYNIGESMKSLASIAPGQYPSAHQVMPSIDLRNTEDFGGLDFYFITRVETYLNVAAAGLYKFKVEADDGYRLTVAGSLLLEYDGLQAAKLSDEAGLYLMPGVHPVLLEHFQSTGRKQLTLHWMPPWADHYEILGAPALSTEKEDERRSTAGKKQRLRSLSFASTDVESIDVSGLHPGLALHPIESEELRGIVGGMDRMSNGRLVVATWDDGVGRVFIIQRLGEGGGRATMRKFADGLNFPMGLKVVDDEIYVLQAQELTHLIDNDGDGAADEYGVVANDWRLTNDYRELSFGLDYAGGSFYAGLAVPIDEEGAIMIEELPGRGELVRIGLDGIVTPVADGMQIPNGLHVNEDGAVMISDHRNPWFSDSRLLYIQPGVGRISALGEANLTGSIEMASIWLPPGSEAPAEPMRAPAGPYRGQWLVGDLHSRLLKRISLDRVNGKLQGVVYPFSGDLPFSIGRMMSISDSSALAGGMSFSAQWKKPVEGMPLLSRLEFTDQSAFEMHSIHAIPGGFEITFMRAIDSEGIDDTGLISVFSWPNSSDLSRRVREVVALTVDDVELRDGGRKMMVRVAGLTPSSVVYFNLDPSLKSTDGDALWTNEAWYSLNVLPDGPVEQAGE